MAAGLTISRSDTSRNILKNRVLSITIRGLFVKIQDGSNNISQFEGFMRIFYCFVPQEQQFMLSAPRQTVLGPAFPSVKLSLTGSLTSIRLKRYLRFSPVNMTGNKWAP